MTLLPALFAASASLLIVSGLCTFVLMAWQGAPPPPPPAPQADPASPDDPDPRLDVWAEFDRQRDVVVV